jgi:hypothetical protein
MRPKGREDSYEACCMGFSYISAGHRRESHRCSWVREGKVMDALENMAV